MPRRQRPQARKFLPMLTQFECIPRAESAAALRLRRRLTQQFRDSLNKTAGRLDGRRGLRHWDHCVRTCLVIGNGIQLASLREKAPQLEINPRFVRY